MRRSFWRTAGLVLGLLGAASPAFAIIGRPFTPLSFAGVARRTVRRSAVYGGAMYGAGMYPGAMYGAGAAYPYGAAAAAGTAAALMALPPGCMVGISCGGVIYQPVYQGTTVVYVPQ